MLDYVIDGEWGLRVADDYAEIESIRAAWSQLQGHQESLHPNGDMDRFISLVRPHPEAEAPFVLVLSRKGQPTAILGGYQGNLHLPLKFGYKTLLHQNLRTVSFVYGAALGSLSGEVCSVLLKGLRRLEGRLGIDLFLFNHLNVEGNLYRAIRAETPFWRRGSFPRIDLHWQMETPQSVDGFYLSLSKKHRSNIKRDLRKLEQSHGLRVGRYDTEVLLDEGIRLATGISKKTYQYSLGSGFVDDEWTRSHLSLSVRRGWLRLYVMFLEDQPAAFQLGLHHQHTFFLEMCGYDPAWKKLGIGTALFVKVFENLCGDPGLSLIDFGFGDASYKMSFGTRHWSEATSHLFAARPYPVRVNLLHSGLQGIARAAQAVVRKVGLEARIKRRWRDRLQSSDDPSDCQDER